MPAARYNFCRYAPAERSRPAFVSHLVRVVVVSLSIKRATAVAARAGAVSKFCPRRTEKETNSDDRSVFA